LREKWYLWLLVRDTSHPRKWIDDRIATQLAAGLLEMQVHFLFFGRAGTRLTSPPEWDNHTHTTHTHYTKHTHRSSRTGRRNARNGTEIHADPKF
jgi:hypothetical protein